MEEKTENELSKLNMYEVICTDALNHLQSNSPKQLSEFEKKIIALLKRMFNAEKEFLLEEPDDYFEIYNDTNS